MADLVVGIIVFGGLFLIWLLWMLDIPRGAWPYNDDD